MNLRRFFVPLLLAVILGLAFSDTAIAQGSNEPSRLRQAPFISSPGSYENFNSNPNLSSSSDLSSSEPNNRLTTQMRANPNKGLRAIEGSWNIQLLQKRFEDEFNQQTTTEFRVLADLHYKPLENITFRLAPKFTYTNGFIQTEQVSQSSRSEWGVKEASINADLISSLSVSAGALDQEPDHSTLLLADQSFPSLRMKLQTSEAAKFSAGVRAETAIPTSSSLSTQTKDAEKTPSFNSGSLVLKAQKTVVEAELKVGAYQFQNLPSSVATSSTYLGNTTVSSTGANDSEFIYQYEGTFAAASMTAHFTRNFRMLASGDWIQNAKAPSGLNQGTRAKAGFEADLIRGFQIQPFYEYFRIEPDAAVALYNSQNLNTNRAGYQGGLSLSYRKILKITAAAGERDALFVTPYQMREKTWSLKLETLDVAI